MYVHGILTDPSEMLKRSMSKRKISKRMKTSRHFFFDSSIRDSIILIAQNRPFHNLEVTQGVES